MVLRCCARLVAHDAGADHQIPERSRRACGGRPAASRHRERQHIGGLVAAAIAGVQAFALGRSDHAHRELRAGGAAARAQRWPRCGSRARRAPSRGPRAPHRPAAASVRHRRAAASWRVTLRFIGLHDALDQRMTHDIARIEEGEGHARDTLAARPAHGAARTACRAADRSA